MMLARYAAILFFMLFSGRYSQAATGPDLDFYKGKVISYIVATKPGGGYDAYARMIGKYMQKYIPGATIIVKNVPGAGHIIGANNIYLAKPDGLTMKKHPDLNDVPLASELKITDKAKKIHAIIYHEAELGRVTVAPPRVPAGRLQVLREAYKKALTDPVLLKEAAKMDLDIDPGYGEDVANLVKVAINQPPENVELLKKIIKAE